MNASQPPCSTAGIPGLLLGIDPGLAATGWAILGPDSKVAGCGTIRTAPGPPGPRLLKLVTELREVIERRAVSEAALEELFMGRNASSALGVAQARGAVMTALTAAGIPIFEYKPAQVKAALTGYGMADKAQIARMLRLQLGEAAGADDHATDAIAIALCHVRGRRLKLMTGR